MNRGQIPVFRSEVKPPPGLSRRAYNARP